MSTISSGISQAWYSVHVPVPVLCMYGVQYKYVLSTSTVQVLTSYRKYLSVYSYEYHRYRLYRYIQQPVDLCFPIYKYTVVYVRTGTSVICRLLVLYVRRLWVSRYGTRGKAFILYTTTIGPRHFSLEVRDSLMMYSSILDTIDVCRLLPVERCLTFSVGLRKGRMPKGCHFF